MKIYKTALMMPPMPARSLSLLLLLAGAAGAAAPPPPLPPRDVILFPLNFTSALPAVARFETVHTVAALAGIVNRAYPPRLFTPYLTGPGAGVDGGSDADVEWFNHLTSPGEWLAHTVWHTNLTTLADLVAHFAPSDLPKGVVLYDPTVPATSNLASTAADAEQLLPVLYRPGVPDSVYAQLVAGGPRLPVALDLTRRAGLFAPTKTAAYAWARRRWLAPDAARPANPAKLGYYADLWAAQQGDRLRAAPGLTEVANHDYFIAHRAFFFDLSVWADETPVDDPDQPLGADKAELVAIFEDAYRCTQAEGYAGPTMLHVGGFTPWWFKYTQDGPGGAKVSKHRGVETEWETMKLIGVYNAFDDGDACCVGAMANSAFYQHYPLPARLAQNAKPTVADLRTRGGLLRDDGSVEPRAYAMYYAGDYDGSAWLYNQIRKNFDDGTRANDRSGVPIGWAVDGELSMRFPVAFRWMYDRRTPSDFFISGDSGAGYLNPTLLFPDPTTGRRGDSNVTASGAPAWTAWNARWYDKFDVSFTGFLINGDAGPLTNESMAMYATFSPDGVVVTTDHDPHPTGVYEKENGGAWCLPTQTAAASGAGGLPVVHHVVDLAGGLNASAARRQIAQIVAADRSKADMLGRPAFYVLRTILKTAAFMVDVALGAQADVANLTFVDPYTMGLLVRCATGAVDCSVPGAGGGGGAVVVQ